MSKALNLIGQKFGRLIVIRRVSNNKWRQVRWLCKCDCGNEKIIIGINMRRGCTKSCGCLQKELLSQKVIIHGHNTNGKRSKIYNSWHCMMQRCTNPNNKDYHNYGGCGITVCKRWGKFENFLEDMGEKPKGLQLDRKKNKKGYYKSNCHWVTPKQNSRNKHNNRLITYKGKTQCVVEWCEEYKINTRTFLSRLDVHGWSVGKALTTPIKGKKKDG